MTGPPPDASQPIVLGISQPGLQLAARIADAIGGESGGREALGAAFACGRPIIAVGAIGIWARLLAPHLGNKLADPPVVVVDDAARFAIPIVGGHRGGNMLAERLAELLGAMAVITTATEVLGLPSAETLAERYGWRLEASRDARLHVAAALVNGAPVVVYQDCGDRSWIDSLPPQVTVAPSPPARGDAVAAIFVTDRILPAADGWGEHAVTLRPATLVVGIGSSRGAPAEQIMDLLRSALANSELAEASIALIATAEVKRDEPGILAVADALNAPITCFAAESLAAVAVPNPSVVVARHVQTASVCEAAAMLAARAPRLLVTKRKSAQATVAIARIAGAGNEDGE